MTLSILHGMGGILEYGFLGNETLWYDANVVVCMMQRYTWRNSLAASGCRSFGRSLVMRASPGLPEEQSAKACREGTQIRTGA
jgi:hypothetical protein